MNRIPVEVGSIVKGRYRVERVLGAGTMGVVVQARHLELDATVAIKFLNPELVNPERGDHDACERFRREVKATAQLRGEHVARVLDVGELEGGLPFMVMDLLVGRSLAEELEVRGALPIAEAVGHVLQAIEALAEAHAAGIVHRDLKPANLFLAERADGSRLVKVIDFGISKSLQECGTVPAFSLTRTGMVVGSPLYMAPEQLSSPKHLDTAVDIWSLGVVLFELLTARTPYATVSIPELHAMLLRDPPARPALYRPDLPPALEAIVMRCLERAPQRRFSSVSELGAQLLPFAPAASAVHVERASRIESASQMVEEIAATQRNPGSESNASLPEAVAPKETGSTWQVERGTASTRASRGRGGSRWVVAATLGALVVGSLGIRRVHRGEVSVAPSARGISSAVLAARSLPAPAKSNASTSSSAKQAPIVTMSLPIVAPVESAPAAAPGAPAAAPGASAAGRSMMKGRPASVAATQTPPTMEAGGGYRVPNFGGRR